jgi:hypothetical protein
MTKQEENWELMTVLQIPWYHAEKIESKKDRAFLLQKSEEIKAHFEEQQKQQAAAMAAQQGGIQMPPEANIITP